jgi:hypothetical protein
MEEVRREASASTLPEETGTGEPLKAARARTDGLTITLLLDTEE